MHPDLEKLVQLQRAESRLRQLHAGLDDLPRKRSALEQELAAERSRLDAARAALDQCQKARRQHEGELQALESKRAKYKGQLMEVKTNKEYTAVLHEIEGVEREISACEDQILAELERSEALTGDVRREEQAFKQAEVAGKERLATLEGEERTLRAQLAEQQRERDGVAGTLPSQPLELFQRVARARGVAVSEARESMCTQCHVRLRPQMMVDVKRNDGIVQCPSCSRILFFEPPVPTVDVQL
jgi:hypothetical protein